MTDIENQPTGIQKTMSLRKRKNLQSTLGISTGVTDDDGWTSQQTKHRQSGDRNKLIREINAVTDADMDDEETKEMKKKMMMYQKKSNDAMANSLMRIIIGIIIVFIIIYCIAYFNEPTDEPSLNNTVLKVLRILVGIKPNLNFLSSSKIVASTSVSKSTLDEFLLPQYPWQKRSSSTSKYLVPALNKPVQHILHETTKLKHQRGINVELYDDHMMRVFLINHGHECSNEGKTDKKSIPSIVEKFDELNASSPEIKIGAKSLWLWCMMYTGETYGHLDIDNHIVEMDIGLTKRISLHDNPGGLGNVVINPVLSHDSDQEVESALYSRLSFSTSMLFVSTTQSKVAKGMIDSIVNSSTSFNQHSQIERLQQLIKDEKDEHWTLINPHCKMIPTDEYKGKIQGRICGSKRDREDNPKGPCCYLIL